MDKYIKIKNLGELNVYTIHNRYEVTIDIDVYDSPSMYFDMTPEEAIEVANALIEASKELIGTNYPRRH